jgi:hypothetical protein
MAYPWTQAADRAQGRLPRRRMGSSCPRGGKAGEAAFGVWCAADPKPWGVDNTVGIPAGKSGISLDSGKRRGYNNYSVKQSGAAGSHPCSAV